MTTSSGYIKTGNEQLHYIKYGDGEQLIIAFHGYGDDGSFFNQLADCIADNYSIVSFDLPHHSYSKWSALELWEYDELHELVDNTLKQFNVINFSLLGYSIGGRVCMSLLDKYHDNINKLVLIASDGLRFNWFYYWLTRTTSGKFIFNSFLTDPKPYMPLIDLARRVKLLNAGKYKFAMKYINSEIDRKFLLNVWITMSLLIPDVKKVKKIIQSKSISTQLFMGKYDKVIPVKLGLLFVDGLDSADVSTLEKGHRVFDSVTLPKIASCFS